MFKSLFPVRKVFAQRFNLHCTGVSFAGRNHSIRRATTVSTKSSRDSSAGENQAWPIYEYIEDVERLERY
jgi:hypothetical protein